MVGELPRQPLVREVVLGDDQQPRRVLVDAVDDPGPRDPADPAQRSAAMVEQRIDHRPVAIARGGVDDEPGGLVDDEQMLVLIDDAELDLLRLVVRGLGGGDGEGEGLVALHLDRRVAHREPVGAGQRAGLGQHLEPFARQRRHAVGKRAVEPPAAVARSERDFKGCLPPGH